MSALDLRIASASELKEQLGAERSGLPFLVYRDAEGRRRLVLLPITADRLTIGRRASNDLSFPWDASVSRVHAQLERIGADWALVDEGLSCNGSFVNGVRVTGRGRLRDGDVVQVGETLLLYRRSPGQTDPTMELPGHAPPPTLSAVQRRVLIALARPCGIAGSLSAPATNQEIAGELGYSVDAVKAHLRVLFHKFGVEHLPQNQKRIKLVDAAFRIGAISRADLERSPRR